MVELARCARFVLLLSVKRMRNDTNTHRMIERIPTNGPTTIDVSRVHFTGFSYDIIVHIYRILFAVNKLNCELLPQFQYTVMRRTFTF